MSADTRTESDKDSPEGPTTNGPKEPRAGVSSRSWKDRVLVAVGTCFGLGYVPWAPGTVSALLGVGIYAAISWLAPPSLHVWLISAGMALFCGLTLLLAPWAERYWQRPDPNVFVTDEVAGFLFTVLLFRTQNVFLTAIWAFVLTRFFDILKVPPARQAERLPGGIGVLADDLCSSLWAAGVLRLLSVFCSSWFCTP